jgi:hypothetical protein
VRFTRHIGRPSPATVIASGALIVALGGGGALAASTIPAGSVGHRQLRNNSVWKNNLSRGIRADLAKIEHLKSVRQGGTGPQGPVGPPGPRGTAGSEPVRPVYFAGDSGSGNTTILSANGIKLSASCDRDGRIVVVAQPTSTSSAVLSWAWTGFQGFVPRFDTVNAPSVTILPAGTPAPGRAAVLINYVSLTGRIVTGEFAASDAGDNPTNGLGHTCVLFGELTVS